MLNTRIAEYVHVNVVSIADNRWVVNYEPLEMRGASDLAGTVDFLVKPKATRRPPPVNTGYVFSVPDEAPPRFQCVGSEKLPAALKSIRYDGRHLQFEWIGDPGEHYLTVSYNYPDEVIEEEAVRPKAKWLTEGF